VCGSIIDAKGREVPITEQMIQQACKAWKKAGSSAYAKVDRRILATRRLRGFLLAQSGQHTHPRH
jgi:hypothetical protein